MKLDDPLDPDRQERWILVRGDREPCVYPFDNQEAAQDFALDHGMLDWRAERNDDPKKPHEEICGSCREPWPCKVVRLDREASAIIWAAKHACQRCKKSAGWNVKVPGGGDLGEDAVYHARKGTVPHDGAQGTGSPRPRRSARSIRRADPRERRAQRAHPSMARGPQGGRGKRSTRRRTLELPEGCAGPP